VKSWAVWPQQHWKAGPFGHGNVGKLSRLVIATLESWAVWPQQRWKAGPSGHSNVEKLGCLVTAPLESCTHVIYPNHLGKLLLAMDSADVDSRDNKYDRTPLSWVAENGHKPVVKLLLDAKADVNSKSNR
jgi:hypothetical protein